MSTYNINMNMLCERCGLGRLIAEPKPISGGLLHKMFEVKTEAGHFAVKALNPNIMEREAAYGNYVRSERIANKLAETIAVSCARSIGGSHLQELDGQYYLIYDFVKGNAIMPAQIEPKHAFQIGLALARIHNADPSEPGIACENAPVHMDIAWDFYAEKGEEEGAAWAQLLLENAEHLAWLTDRMNEAAASLGEEVVLCHGDLDPKNVLWAGDEPILIDWECAAVANPYHDFMETALYWSVRENLAVDEERFRAFVQGYMGARNVATEKREPGDGVGNPAKCEWKSVLYYGLSSKLGWLEYSLKRSLGMENADEAEQRLGTEQVFATIEDIKAYVRNMDLICGLMSPGGSAAPQ